MLLNPESYGEKGGRPQKRVCTGTPLVRCGGDKSLFICTFEVYEKPFPTARYADFAYVVRSINLHDLVSSSEKLELREVARMDDNDLPDGGGCGVLGSKIVFASGLKPSPRNPKLPIGFGPDSSTDAYAFDVHDPNQGIVKMPGALNGGKQKALMAEFAGKLYALCLEDYYTFVSFEVYDPEQGTWSLLPEYPNHGSHHSYAIVGSRLFISSQEHREVFHKSDPTIFCFDLAAHVPEWRRLPSMCQGGPLPFTGRALVLDLPQPEHSNMKLLFSVRDDDDWFLQKSSLLVHLMYLDENHEDISEIMEMKLPDAALPEQPGDCHIFHLGGNNLCLVTTCMSKPEKKYKADHRGIVFTVQGAAIPFQFEFDISKVDKDRKNCFTGQFQPPRIFEYHLDSESTAHPHRLGCLVL